MCGLFGANSSFQISKRSDVCWRAWYVFPVPGGPYLTICFFRLNGLERFYIQNPDKLAEIKLISFIIAKFIVELIFYNFHQEYIFWKPVLIIFCWVCRNYPFVLSQLNTWLNSGINSCGNFKRAGCRYAIDKNRIVRLPMFWPCAFKLFQLLSVGIQMNCCNIAMKSLFLIKPSKFSLLRTDWPREAIPLLLSKRSCFRKISSLEDNSFPDFMRSRICPTCS